MNEKVIMLHSGGMDSVVLAHYLKYELNKDVTALHFSYNALNENKQQECVEKCCNKLGQELIKISIPEMSWTKGDFFNSGTYSYDTQYVEYRNLIFISYAASIAESMGIKEIYLATLAGNYNDNSDEFYGGLNSALVKSGIKIICPFRDFIKLNLLPYIREYNINQDEFFSCDTPVRDKEGNLIPCGECNDCFDVNEIYDFLKEDMTVKRFFNSGRNYKDERFKKMLASEKSVELRLCINNECQLKCEHCFYGFDEMFEPQLTKDEICGVIRQADEYGFENIHFCGKEPLVNDDIFYYLDFMNKETPNLTKDLVTNGLTLPIYAKRLKESGVRRVCLSVDDILDTNGVRSVHNSTEKALNACMEAELPVTIFLDLHKNNVGKTYDIIKCLSENWYDTILDISIRTIKPLGNAKDFELLTYDELSKAFNDSCRAADEFMVPVALNIYNEYADEIDRHKDDDLGIAVYACESLYTSVYTEYFSVWVERYCNRYGYQVTVTPDGFVLGCAMELSVKDYKNISVGNIRDKSLEKLINEGKEKILYNVNDVFCSGCKKRCTFLLNK